MNKLKAAIQIVEISSEELDEALGAFVQESVYNAEMSSRSTFEGVLAGIELGRKDKK